MIRLSMLSATYILCGVMDITVGSLRGMGQTIVPMIVSLIGVCGIRVIWITTVFQIPAYHTINTIYVSYPVSWTVTGLTHLICWFVVIRKVNKTALRSN
jgi:Na+-driven multidrug efflux pump